MKLQKDSVVMIVVFIIVVFGITGLLLIRQTINYCKTEGNTTDARSICFKPSDFCKMKCESFGDNFTGKITPSTCVCENGAVAHQPGMKSIREYWNNTDIKLLNL